VEDPGLDGRLGRKKKTPEEMEAEANGEIPADGAEGIMAHAHRADQSLHATKTVLTFTA